MPLGFVLIVGRTDGAVPACRYAGTPLPLSQTNRRML